MQRVIDIARSGAWLTRERLGTYCALLLVGTVAMICWLLVSGNGVLDARGRPIGTDFANVWSSGNLVLEGRPAAAFDPDVQRPYQQRLFGMSDDLFYGWHYPPMFLLIAGLLALLPYLPALALWLLASGAFYLATIRQILPQSGDTARLVVLAALAYPATLACITHGHNGFLTAGLFGMGLLLLPTRPIAAGILLGLLAYKPQYGLLLPIALLVTRQWSAIGAAAATVIVTVALSLALFGSEAWQAFFTHAAYTKATILENGAAGWFKLQGLFPAIRMYGGSLALAYAAQALAIVLLAGLTVWIWSSRVSHEVKAAGLVVATMLATPYAFNYDSVLLGVAIAFLVREGLARGFAPFEISALAALWGIPLCSRELTLLLHLPIALLVQVAVLAVIIARVRQSTVTRLAYVV